MHRSEKLLVPTAALKGAHNAVKVCLAIGKNDKVVVITDSETEGIGNALMEESEKAGAAAEKLLLEDFGQRPFTSIPEGLAQALRSASPTATFFAAQGEPGG